MQKMLQAFRAAYLLVGLLAAARGNLARADDAAAVQPLLSETTALVLKVDPSRLALPDVAEILKEHFPNGKDAYERWARDVTKGIESLRGATEGQAVYATIGIPLSKHEWPVFVFTPETSDASRQRFADLLGSLFEVQSRSRNGYTVVVPRREVDVETSLNAVVPSPRAELPAAFEAVQEYPIQLLLLPPAYVRRTVLELMPQLPRHLGGGPSNVLTDGLIWAAIGIDPARPRVALVIQSGSEKAAQDLAVQLPKMMLAAYDEWPAVKESVPRDTFISLLPLAKPQVVGDRITIRLDERQSTTEGLRLLARAPAAVSEQIRRRTNTDSFKKILLAMHNYYDVYEVFPPRNESRDSDGNSGLSWRVHILPFLDETKLYEEFALDQPWDSPHNKALIEKMPQVYQSQWLGIVPGHTTFLAPVGDDTVFGGAKSIKFQNITDGTSNTVILVEVKPSLSVPWTAPQDYAFDSEQPSAGLRVGSDGRFLSANADGSVNMLRANIAAELMLRLFRKGDGNPIDWNAVR